MIRETKQERLVRGMFDQVVEHMHELKALAANPATKELDIERWCQSVLRNCLGFTATNGYSIRAQETRGKMRPDLIIVKDERPVCVVEVKKLDHDLNKSDFRSGKVQLSEYLHSIGTVNWGILCNGYNWRLYDFTNLASNGVTIAAFDIRNEQGEVDIGKKAIEEICWDFVDVHESACSSGNWAELYREATAFSPDSLTRAILSADTVKYVARVIRGEHDYRANTEVLFDKLQRLLETGLKGMVDWNDVKEAELHKYVTTQKRVGRKKRSQADTKDQPAPAANGNGTTEAAAAAKAEDTPEKKVA